MATRVRRPKVLVGEAFSVLHTCIRTRNTSSCDGMIRARVALITNAHPLVVSLMLTFLGTPWLSILFASVTVWPNRQYRGIWVPTTPAMAGPEWTPIRICNDAKHLLCNI